VNNSVQYTILIQTKIWKGTMYTNHVNCLIVHWSIAIKLSNILKVYIKIEHSIKTLYNAMLQTIKFIYVAIKDQYGVVIS